MQSRRRPPRPILLACSLAMALAAAGCSTFTGGGSDAAGTAAATTDATAMQQSGEIDPRRYLGPNYCPELRVLDGRQLVRTYERGHEGEAGFVVWQASVGQTARECLYDLQNNLTLKVGVTGRVIAGPKGGTGAVTVPLRIAVVKFKEAVLASELFPLAITIPPGGSTAFTEVREITVPSPGEDRDYILYVALAEEEQDWVNPTPAIEEPAVAVVEEPIAVLEEAAPPPPPAAAPPKPATPQELPTPTGGFVLTR